MKPSKQQIEQALEVARRLSEEDLDADLLGTVLIYLERRVADLDRVREQAERYLLFGMGVEDHRKLVQLLRQVREHERQEAGAEGGDFGLGGGPGT